VFPVKCCMNNDSSRSEVGYLQRNSPHPAPEYDSADRMNALFRLLVTALSIVVVVAGGDGDPSLMCATLNLYASPFSCDGNVLRELKITAFSEPGSPCISDHKDVPGISINNSYCTPDFYHQTVYQGSETCDSEGIDSFYKKNSCESGLMFQSCTPGACEGGESSLQLPVIAAASATTK